MNTSNLSNLAAQNITFLGLFGWIFEGDDVGGAFVVTSPEGIRFFYDRGCEEKAVADAMSLQSVAATVK